MTDPARYMNSNEPTDQPSDAAIFRMLSAILSPEFATAHAAVSRVADYRVPPAEDSAFVQFIEWINTRPAFIQEWRNDPASEQQQYLRFMTGLDACRAGYAASHYHLERVREIENSIHAVLGASDLSKAIPPNSVGALGGTRRFDFEYQAYVLAYRRSLDGLAWGFSTYFKSDISSFNAFSKKVHKLHPPAVGNALSTAIARHIGNFEFVIGTEKGRSVRDRIAHREAVQAGCINISSKGHAIFGGGENLGMDNLQAPPHLADVLRLRLDHLNSCIFDLLNAFQEAVSASEGGQVK